MTESGKVMNTNADNITNADVLSAWLNAVANFYAIPREMVLLNWLKAVCA